jgi:nucleoside-diphosphate-sugar epimerase
VGRSANPNTVLNYFYYHLAKGLNFDLWVNAWRNLLDVDDMFEIVNELLQQKENSREIINIANTESYNVRTIVSEMERVLGLEGNYVPIERGQAFDIDVRRIEPVIQKLGINFDHSYLTRLIEKYYTKA